MSLFTLNPDLIDWSKTNNLVTFVVAGYAAWVATLTYRRSLKRVQPAVAVESRQGDRSAVVKVYVSNEGNHAFSIKRVRAMGVRNTVIRRVFDAADKDVEDRFLAPGQIVAFTLEAQGHWPMVVANVEVTLNDGTLKTVTVDPNAELYLDWYELVAFAVRSVLPEVEYLAKGYPFRADYKNKLGSKVSYFIFDPLAAQGKIGELRDSAPQVSEAYWLLVNTYPMLFASVKDQQSGRDIDALEWSKEATHAFESISRARVEEFRSRVKKARATIPAGKGNPMDPGYKPVEDALPAPQPHPNFRAPQREEYGPGDDQKVST